MALFSTFWCFGESGRIKDDEVILVAGLVKETERLFGKGFMAGVAGEVQFHVAVRQFDGTLGDIHRMHQFRAAAHGVEGETTGVAEHVQHAPPPGILFQEAAVLALVDEKACFLPFQPIDIEFQPVFQRHEVLRGAVEVAVFRLDGGFVGEGAFGLVIDGGQAVAQHLAEGTGDVLALEVHAHGMELHDCHAGIVVHDQSRQVVPFAVHEAVHIVVRSIRQSDGLTQAVGGSDAVAPKGVIDGHVLEGEDAHGNGADLAMSGRHVTMVGSVDFYDIAFLQVTLSAGNGAGEYPGMITEHGAVFAGLQDNFIGGHGFCRFQFEGKSTEKFAPPKRHGNKNGACRFQSRIAPKHKIDLLFMYKSPRQMRRISRALSRMVVSSSFTIPPSGPCSICSPTAFPSL